MDKLTKRYENGRVGLADGVDTLRALERLDAYENTGMGPLDMQTFARWLDGMPYQRFNELLQADPEGRVVVFPFKLGDHVWINGVLGACQCEEHVITSVSCHLGSKKEIWFHAELVGYLGEARCSFGLDQIGKNVFRTREEAEEALKEDET